MKRDGCPTGQVLFKGKCIPIPKNKKECRELFSKENVHNYKDLKRVIDAMYKEPKNFIKLKKQLLSIGGKKVIDERDNHHPMGGMNDTTDFFRDLANYGKLYSKNGLRCSKTKEKITEDDQGVKYLFPPTIDVSKEYRIEQERIKYGHNCHIASGYALDEDDIWRPHYWLVCDKKIVEISGKPRKKYFGHKVRKGYWDFQSEYLESPEWSF